MIFNRSPRIFADQVLPAILAFYLAYKNPDSLFS